VSTVIPHTGSVAIFGRSSIIVLVLGPCPAPCDRYSPGVYRTRRRGRPRRSIREMDPVVALAARAALDAERARLRAELDAGIEAPGQMTYGSQAAAASQVFAQQRDLALHDKATKELELVEAALARLEAGTFGTCLRCGNEIASARLEALPWAAYCITCQKLAADGR